jgi:hypothetical protein
MDTKETNELQKKYNVVQGVLKDSMGMDIENIQMIEYAQQCLTIYEETLRAMGVLIEEKIGEAVDNSQLKYTEAEVKDAIYANLPEHY